MRFIGILGMLGIMLVACGGGTQSLAAPETTNQVVIKPTPAPTMVVATDPCVAAVNEEYGITEELESELEYFDAQYNAAVEARRMWNSYPGTKDTASDDLRDYVLGVEWPDNYFEYRDALAECK